MIQLYYFNQFLWYIFAFKLIIVKIYTSSRMKEVKLNYTLLETDSIYSITAFDRNKCSNAICLLLSCLFVVFD